MELPPRSSGWDLLPRSRCETFHHILIFLSHTNTQRHLHPDIYAYTTSTCIPSPISKACTHTIPQCTHFTVQSKSITRPFASEPQIATVTSITSYSPLPYQCSDTSTTCIQSPINEAYTHNSPSLPRFKMCPHIHSSPHHPRLPLHLLLQLQQYLKLPL